MPSDNDVLSTRAADFFLDKGYTERSLCTGIGLVSVAMFIITGTTIVLMLANVSPVVRTWPEGMTPWKIPISGGKDSVDNDVWERTNMMGPSHVSVTFDTADYRVTNPENDVPRRYPIYPDVDDAVGPELGRGSESYGPVDDPKLIDEFADRPGNDDKFDRGLANVEVNVPVSTVLRNMSHPERGEDGRAAWNETLGARGLVFNLPGTGKPKIKPPFKVLSKLQAAFISWNESANSFLYKDSYETYDALRPSGFFGSRDAPKPLVIFAHGWHGALNDTQLFRGALRLHSRAITAAAALLLDWDAQGATRDGNTAALYAWRVNVTGFLQQISPHTQLHCVGHFIGTFACASICRQFYHVTGRRCSRLLAIEPYDILDTVPEVTGRVKSRNFRRDADYVAILASGTRNMAADDDKADEYIIFNNLAASSSVCDNATSWGIDVCASDYNIPRRCEHLGVRNVTFTEVPSDMKKYCSSMMSTMYFLTAMGADIGFAGIRFNPAAVSDLRGMLPTVWDARVYSKDYRYSTFVRNESIWYWANAGQNGTEVAFLNAFVVVVPTISQAIILGANHVTKTKYHDVSVYSSFLNMTKGGDSLPNVTVVTSGPILAAYAWGGTGHADVKFSPDMPSYKLPSAAQKFVKYACDKAADGFLCRRTDASSAAVVLRRRLPVNNVSIPLPPETCFPYTPPNINLIAWQRQPISVETGVNITMTYSHTRQLLAAILESHEVPDNTTLFTFYDSCESVSSAGVYFAYDWLNGEVVLTFLTPGRYTLRWYFLVEVLEVPITVREAEDTEVSEYWQPAMT